MKTKILAPANDNFIELEELTTLLDHFMKCASEFYKKGKLEYCAEALDFIDFLLMEIEVLEETKL